MIGQLTEAGVFGKPHGIKGEIAASIDIDGIDIAADDFVFARIDGLDVPFRVEAVRYKGSGYLLTLKGVNDEKAASRLSGGPLYMECDIDDSDGSDSDQVYLEDLIGFTVTDRGEMVGTIDDYSEPTPHNPLFVLRRPDGTELLVPASDELIVDIDFDNNNIDMDLPEGLVDLNSSKK